jgi:VWFA-related protein
VVIGAALLAVAVQPTRGGQAPVFRGRADAVSVTVVVRDRQRAVPNLTAGDFQLFDNGVLQEISSTSSELVPVDATLVLDTSGSVQGDAFVRLKRDIERMAGLLKPDDRVRLITFASRVVDVLGLQPGNTNLPLDRLKAGGSTSLENALAAALMIGADTDRPHLVFALTDGVSSPSFMDARRLVRLAEYSSAVLYIALVPPVGSKGIDRLDVQARVNAGLRDIVRRPTVPYREALQDAVKAAGGRLYEARPESPPDLFRQALADFRQSYVLRYTPRGVATAGWHDITVTLPKLNGLVVRSRRGYEQN